MKSLTNDNKNKEILFVYINIRNFYSKNLNNDYSNNIYLCINNDNSRKNYISNNGMNNISELNNLFNLKF